jgi:hypothetical protein
LSQEGSVAEDFGIAAFILSEETSTSPWQEAILRRLSSEKSSEVLCGGSMLYAVTVLPAFLVFLIFVSLCSNHMQASLGFVVEFIHRKDGKK